MYWSSRKSLGCPPAKDYPEGYAVLVEKLIDLPNCALQRKAGFIL